MAADLIYDHSSDLDPTLQRSTELMVNELDRFESLLSAIQARVQAVNEQSGEWRAGARLRAALKAIRGVRVAADSSRRGPEIAAWLRAERLRALTAADADPAA